MASAYLVTFAASIGISYAVLKFAPALGLQDIPNDRSLHSIPKPRGGGLSFVLLGLFWSISATGFGTAAGIGAMSAIALVGIWDDRRSLSPVVRIIVHVGAALIFVAAYNSSAGLELGPLGFAFWVVFLVGMTNLFNFMDGIDGLVATEFLFVILAWWAIGGEIGRVPALGLAAAVAGFLVLNWQPAKIFMGDVGSGFLGFVLGAMTLALSQNAVELPVSMILMSMFIGDGTFTLIRRALTGQKFYQAHRDHAYQHLVQMKWSHARVSILYIVLNVFWAFPLAYLAPQHGPAAWLVFALSVLPIFAIAWKVKAGIPLGKSRN